MYLANTQKHIQKIVLINVNLPKKYKQEWKESQNGLHISVKHPHNCKHVQIVHTIA